MGAMLSPHSVKSIAPVGRSYGRTDDGDFA